MGLGKERYLTINLRRFRVGLLIGIERRRDGVKAGLRRVDAGEVLEFVVRSGTGGARDQSVVEIVTVSYVRDLGAGIAGEVAAPIDDCRCVGNRHYAS